MDCFRFLHNLTDKQADGFTAWQNRLQLVGGAWSGDYYIVDIEELENAESAADVHVKRIKGIVVPPGKPISPLADGSVKQPCPGARRKRRFTTYFWRSNAGGEISPDNDEDENKNDDEAEEEVRQDETDSGLRLLDCLR